MRRRRAAHRGTFTIAFVAVLATLPPEAAVAGEYAVGNCGADQLNFSTRAFNDFATRGMKIRRACDPEGPGLRGLITSNVVRGGQVPRGAVALATMTAPAGHGSRGSAGRGPCGDETAGTRSNCGPRHPTSKPSR